MSKDEVAAFDAASSNCNFADIANCSVSSSIRNRRRCRQRACSNVGHRWFDRRPAQFLPGAFTHLPNGSSTERAYVRPPMGRPV